MTMHSLLLFAHITSVVVWVGGMFFAYVCLRPAAVALLQPPERLRLWHGVFSRFFPAVWIAVCTIAASGFLMLAGAPTPLYQHLMMGSGLVMIGIFIYVAAAPTAELGRAVEAEDWKRGAAALNRIRQMVGTNLALGFVTIAIATLGRNLG